MKTFRNSGLPPASQVVAAKILMLNPWPAPLPTFDQISKALKVYGPLWAVGRWRSSTFHCIVVTGFDPDNETVTYIDPWPDPPNSNHADEATHAFSWFSDALRKNYSGSIMNWPTTNIAREEAAKQTPKRLEPSRS